MASLFKPPIVEYRLRDGSYRTPDGKRVTGSTPGAVKSRRRSKKWYGRFTDADGRPHKIPLSESKEVARRMLAKLAGDAQLEGVGLGDKFAEHRARPLREHLDDFKDWLLSVREVSPKQVDLVVGRVRHVLDGCDFKKIGDFDDEKVERHLTELRNEGKSVQTCNFYLGALKQFAGWLVGKKRMPYSPFQALKGGNVELDRRHDRRHLDESELRKVLDAARQSGKKFRGLTGPDRYAIYLTACGTGFRAAELASLRPASCDLDGDPPTITIQAKRAKNRRTVVQPIPADLAAFLKGYLAGRPDDAAIWPGKWFHRAYVMLQRDLEACGIPYVTDGPDGPLYADFHALRHSYITLLERAGVGVKLAQELARHSDINLTMKRYTHAQLRDRGQAVDKLPALTAAAAPPRKARMPG